jgi:hypothetical protein
MNGSELLAKRVRSAAVAGWWTILVIVGLMTAQWFFVLMILDAKPDWLLKLWGGGELDWPTVHTIVLWFFTVFKLMMFGFVIAVIWLTLWSSRLKRVK